jgi:hypothetical protein
LRSAAILLEAATAHNKHAQEAKYVPKTKQAVREGIFAREQRHTLIGISLSA